MRETRFYEFQSEATASSSELFQVHPLRPPHPSSSFTPSNNRPEIRAAGLAAGLFSWRIIQGKTIVIENIVDHSMLRIELPGLLTCHPIIVPRDSQKQLQLLAAFETHAACEFIHLNIDFPLNRTNAETITIAKAQLDVKDNDSINVLFATPDHHHTFFGCLSGRCGQIARHGDSLHSQYFQFPHNSYNDDEAYSMSSDLSRRSAIAATPATPSLISRISSTARTLLQTPAPSPRVSEVWNGSASTPRGSLRPFSTSRSSRSRQNFGERVEALEYITLTESSPGSFLVVLHASGRICAFLRLEPGNFRFAGETRLGLKLSNDFSKQILLRSREEELAAVLTVDEDPQANSVRIFSVSFKVENPQTVAITCRQLVKRSGPIEKIVGAVMIGLDDIIVGTETGAISGLLISGSNPGADDNGIGLPSSQIWTAIDDTEQPMGLGSSINLLLESDIDRLLSAHRFSADVVAKASRLVDFLGTSRAVVEKHVRSTFEGPEPEKAAMLEKALQRAEFLSVDMDMPLLGLEFVDGVGVVTARNGGLFVFRALHTEEKGVLGRELASYEVLKQNFTGPVALLAAAQGSVQIFLAALSRMDQNAPSFIGVRFLTKQSLAYSDVRTHISLTDRIVMDKALEFYGASSSGHRREEAQFASAVSSIHNLLAPGGNSMSFLFDINELSVMKNLAINGPNDPIPVSAFFGAGIWWIDEVKKCRSRNGEDLNAIPGAAPMVDENLEMEPISVDSRTNLKEMLDKAFGNFVSAAKLASTNDGLTEEDSDCAMVLAKISREKIGNEDEMIDDNRADSPVSGMEDDPVKGNLGYWLLERSVRIFESVGASKWAAAAALEAMGQAPSRDLYEIMRSAAFSRFLDSRRLETALEAMLRPPFGEKQNTIVSKSEAGALRDGMALFVNEVAEYGMLSWLVERNLPEPLKSLAALTFEQRARAAEPIDVDAELFSMQSNGEGEGRRKLEYENLFAWHINNVNYAEAAAAALEWGERLSRENEGLRTVLSASFSRLQTPIHHAQLKLLLAWANMKARAFSCAHATVQLLDAKRRYFVRSKFSVMGQDPEYPISGIVPAEWAARRNLLAKAQSLIFTRMISESDEKKKFESANFLMAPGVSCLQDNKEGVSWAIDKLVVDVPNLENYRVAAQMAAAWSEEFGTNLLEKVVKDGAKMATNRGVFAFGYEQLQELLVDVETMGQTAGVSKNWGLIAFESALVEQGAAENGVFIPQWLVDRAAWGATEDHSDALLGGTGTKRKGSGDASGVVRALLRVGRPVAAAILLLSFFERFEIQRANGRKEPSVSYSAIDATIIRLKQGDESVEDDEDIETRHYLKMLEGQYEKHVEATQYRFRTKQLGF